MIAFATMALAAQDTPRYPSRSGHIEVIEGFESKALANKRRIWVYLPPSYAKNPTEKYPVFYMHDGQNLFDGMTSYIPNKEWKCDESAEALIDAGVIRPLIIVGIDNAGMDRGNEYLPSKVKFRGAEMGGKANLYTQMLTDEIMPMINSKYRTLTGPKNTAVGGSSFGGIISLHIGLTRPDVYGYVAALSPSLWWDNHLLTKNYDALKAKLPFKLWMDIGTKEGPEAVPDCDAMDKVLKHKGWKPRRDYTYVVDSDAEHNEVAWSHRFPAILRFFFGK